MQFFEKYKVQLLRGALKRGLATFTRQAYLIFLDSAIRQKHLIFKATREDIPHDSRQTDSALSFQEILSWHELRIDDQKILFNQQQAIDIGGLDWFDRGWRLWIGEVHGRLAVLGWWRSAEQSEDFFCPLPDDAELLWHATTLPGFQGMELHIMLRVTLMEERMKSGINSFYMSCRDYNTPSHRNILKMGFRNIGYYTVSKWTGKHKRHWFSEPKVKA